MRLAGLFASIFWAFAVTIYWEAPTTRVDGSPLDPSEIGGYWLHCGPSPGNYTHTVHVAGNTHSVRADFLPHGRSYCVVTVYDTNGGESYYSEEGSGEYKQPSKMGRRFNKGRLGGGGE